jgi:glucose dehydrogenase
MAQPIYHMRLFPQLWFRLVVGLAISFTGAAPALAQSQAPAEEWRFYGGDAGGTRFSPLRQINRKNIGQLKRAWTYHTGEIDDAVSKGENGFAFQCTPIVVSGVMYFSTPNNRIIALEAETGKELWVFDPKLDHEKIDNYVRSRGVAYWEGGTDKGRASRRIFFGTNDGRLIALDALTGKPCADFGRRGEIDLRLGVADEYPDENYMVTSPPSVYRNMVIVGGGANHGNFRARTERRCARFRRPQRQAHLALPYCPASG